ncbi:MAG TPA: CBS domain-containing protein [Hyphomicrobiaceae bacterium]|nr:CBS domain-containing protein [Hyphomicrobiaceae bacterium]
MKIKDVLASKSSSVVTVRPNKRVDKLPKLFDERNIASAVVVDALNRTLGIVTDRLFMKALARQGVTMLECAVADIMESPAPSCSPEHTVQDAMRLMTDLRVRHLVVRDNGKMLGIVSIGDLVKFRLEEAEMESRVLRELALGHITAEAVE